MNQTDQILGATNLEIVLTDEHTLLHWLSGGRYSYIVCCFDFLNNKNIRYSIYLFLITICSIITVVESHGRVIIVVESVKLVLNTIICLRCNLFVFKQSLLTFNTYYKCINLLIALIAYHIDYNFYQSSYSNDTSFNLILIISFISMTNMFLSMLIVSNIDGYNANPYILAIVICLLFFYLFFKMYIFSHIYYESKNALGNIFGYTFHWNTIATSCMTSSLVFLALQAFYTIKYPLKLIMVATFIQFKYDFNDKNWQSKDLYRKTSLDLNDPRFNNQVTIDASFILKIDQSHHAQHGTDPRLYSLTVNYYDNIIYNCCNNNDNNNNKIIQKALSSGKTLAMCAIIGCICAVIDICFSVNHSNEYFKLALRIVIVICLLVPMLSLNVQISKFILCKFVFWWRILDALIFTIGIQMYYYKNNMFNFDEKFSIAFSYVGVFINVLLMVCFVSFVTMMKAFVKKWKYRITLANTILALSIWYFTYLSFQIFVDKPDLFSMIILSFHVTQNKQLTYSISTQTLIIAKTLDLSLFLSGHLVNILRFGFDGIILTGYVSKKWKCFNSYGNHNREQEKSLIQMIDSQQT